MEQRVDRAEERRTKDAWAIHKRYTIPLALSVAISVVCEIIFRQEQLAIIAGISVLAVSMIKELRDFVASCNVNTQRSTSQSFDRLMSLLKIHIKYFSNEWLYVLLTDIVQLSDQAESQQHGYRLVQETIRSGVDDARKIASGDKIWYPEEKELTRMTKLKDVVEDARNYVWAVTFDAHGYLKNFWKPNFGSQYAEANRKAVARNVIVKRIFVLTEAVLACERAEEWRLVQDVISGLLKIRSSNMIVKIARAEDVLKINRRILASSSWMTASPASPILP